MTRIMPEFTKGIDPWYWCTSEGSEMFNLLIGFEETFQEKLQWLEEAENLTLLFEKNRQRQNKNLPVQETLHPTPPRT